MSGYANTTPKPYGNLSSPYIKADKGGDLYQLYTKLYFGPIVFLSPTKVRIYVRCQNTKTSIIVYYSELYVNLILNTVSGNIITNNHDKYTSNDDYDTTFSGEFETTEPIKSITCNYVRGYIDATSASSSPAISGTFESTIPVITPTQPYIVTASYKMTHILLPQNPVTGQWYRIKSGINARVHIHTLGVPVDNAGLTATSYICNQQYKSMQNASNITTPYTAYGFTMEEQDSCMVIFNGSVWVLQEYRNGGLNGVFTSVIIPMLLDQYLSWSTLSPSSVGITPLPSSDVVITDLYTGNKIFQLPNPATYIGIKYILAKTLTNNTTYTLSVMAPVDGGGNYLLEDGNEVNSFFDIFNPAPIGQKKGNLLTCKLVYGNQICLTLLSDGTKWWIMNTYLGQYTATTNNTPANKIASTSTLSCITNPYYTAITLPALAGISSKATPQYSKLLRTPNNLGIVASSTTGSSIAGTTDIDIVFNTAYKDNTALSFIAYQNPSSGITEYYMTGSFIGY